MLFRHRLFLFISVRSNISISIKYFHLCVIFSLILSFKYCRHDQAGWGRRKEANNYDEHCEKLDDLISALTTAAVMRKLNVRWSPFSPLFTRYVNICSCRKRFIWNAMHVKLNYYISEQFNSKSRFLYKNKKIFIKNS